MARQRGHGREGLRAVLDEPPALVLLVGDFLYHADTTEADRAVEVVRPLAEAEVPVVAVLGNHDYSLMKKDSDERPGIAEYLEERLREVGTTVLENDAVAVPEPDGGDSLWVAGIGSAWAEADDAEAALAVPEGAPRLVLMHNAEAYRDQIGAEGNRLYVNRGIGLSAMPIRFNCPPERSPVHDTDSSLLCGNTNPSQSPPCFSPYS